jgi:Transcriptional regulatory protein, C terminal
MLKRLILPAVAGLAAFVVLVPAGSGAETAQSAQTIRVTETNYRNWFGSTKTLDVHVSALRKKLGDDSSRPRLIHTVRGVGFRFAGPDEVA